MSLAAPERETCLTCDRPFTNGQRSGTCPRCRQAARRARRKAATREDPKQNVPAYLSDELTLSEADRCGV
jgi:predicted amidophosphoribosyltransferase